MSIMLRILISAGEPSGDLLGARLVTALRERRNDLVISCLGGERMARAGADLLFPLAEQGVVGLVEVIKHLGGIRRARKLVLRALDREPPDLLIPIDYPGFNIPLARNAHQRGIPVVYYVSPQVWAWRAGRVKRIREAVEKVLVLFPFEVDTYERAGVPVEHVGHPLLDMIDAKARPAEAQRLPDDRVVVGLLPGSRPAEIRYHLPDMARAADRIARELGPRKCRCIVVAAQELPIAGMVRLLADEVLGASSAPPDVAPDAAEVRLTVPGPLEEIRLVRDPDYAHRAGMHLAITASGTATLENAILGVPTVIVYRLSFLSYQLLRRLVRIPHIGIINLIAGRAICPELIQDRATPEQIARAALDILGSEERWVRMKLDLADVRARLGAPGASARAAEAVLKVLESRSPPPPAPVGPRTPGG